MSRSLEDYRWLVTRQGLDALRKAEELFRSHPLHVAAGRLRRDVSADRARLLLEQCELRQRARAKFPFAQRLFFTRRGLEQASDWWTGLFKAQRFAGGEPGADLCCGIGGDLLAMATRGPMTAVDSDPIQLCLAQANHEAIGSAGLTPWNPASFQCATVEELVRLHSPWHIDPDRRPGGRRSVDVEHHRPNRQTIDDLRSANPNGMVKLAPAAVAPESWQCSAQREWVGRDRQCKQQVISWGNLAQQPGKRLATVLTDDGSAAPAAVRTLMERPTPKLPQATGIDSLGGYVFDPHAAVIAARLVDSLAAELALARIEPGSPYLTGNTAIDDPAVQTFRVEEVLPGDRKRLQQGLRHRNIGRLEIKTAGVKPAAEAWQRQLRLCGEHAAVLLMVRTGRGTRAILAHRLADAGDK